MANSILVEHFRCPETLADFSQKGTPSDQPGYFRFGEKALCFGRTSGGWSSRPSMEPNLLPDAFPSASFEDGRVSLPFDVFEVVSNLRLERYLHPDGKRNGKTSSSGLVRNAYYTLRPLMPQAVKQFLQRTRLSGWQNVPFPAWPVDLSVEHLMDNLLRLSMKASRIDRIPFIWFWPEGFPSCVVMTHDVEYGKGLDFVPRVMDLDESYGFKASFQLVPEGRYYLRSQVRDQICSRGFEICIHDLNHDGELYSERNEFLRRAAKINQYAREFGSAGFRSGALYRNLDWYDIFDFSYDMSVPNVGHLEAQRGGCCTVMPYWIGRILEIPITTTQDYALFHYLRDYSIELWKQQSRIIIARHGLASFLVHPDYIIAENAQQVYIQLLKFLSDLKSERRVWAALPGEVDRWWRARSRMKLVQKEGRWAIEGPEQERARLAYATLDDGILQYEIAREPLLA